MKGRGQRTIDLLETMILEVPVQVTQSTRCLPDDGGTALHRRRGGGEPRDRRGDNRVQTPAGRSVLPPKCSPRPTARPGRGPQDRPNPALTHDDLCGRNASACLWSKRLKDTQLQRLFAVALNKLGDIKLEMNDLLRRRSGLQGRPRNRAYDGPGRSRTRSCGRTISRLLMPAWRRSTCAEARTMKRVRCSRRRWESNASSMTRDVDDRLLKNLQAISDIWAISSSAERTQGGACDIRGAAPHPPPAPRGGARRCGPVGGPVGRTRPRRPVAPRRR